jgi:hypothetical protein
MKAEIIPLKNRLMDAIENVAGQPEEDDLFEEAIIAATEGEVGDIINNRGEIGDIGDESDDFGEEEDAVPPVLSLADLPVADWDSIWLSKTSTFGMPLWDFAEYPHVYLTQVRINWDYVCKFGVNLMDPRYIHWVRIIRALVFYSVPHFAVSSFVRSYGSMKPRALKMRRLIGFFQKHNLYLGEPGKPGFRTISDLAPDTVTQYVYSIKDPNRRWEVAFALQFWQRISFGKLLPVEYAIHVPVITREQVSIFRSEMDANVKPYEPIPLDDYVAIITHCMRLVEDYSKDVLWLYETYYPTIVGVRTHPERGALKPGGYSPNSEKGVAAFLAYQPVSCDGTPWWPLRVRQYYADWQRENKPWGFIPFREIIGLVRALIDACITIILATTGMRKSEVVHLLSGCVSRDPDGYWLRYKVFKTSKASQGDQKRIPIPEIAAKAISIVEHLCQGARTHANSDRLFVHIGMMHFGTPVAGSYGDGATKRVAQAVDAEDGVSPHRFRKTLAMYLVYQDPKNIEVVRQLFSHVSLKMTLRYVLGLPGIKDEMRSIIARQNVDVLLEVLDGALTGRIAGKAGLRLRQSIENSPQIIARLQDKGKESLVQYVESMLDQGIKLLHRTNLAICMKTPGHLESAPCDGKNDDPATKLHPNLFACDPWNCLFAAFVEANIPAMQSEIIFHHKLVHHPYTGDAQKRFSERRIAEVVKRLAELGESETQAFLKEVANG